MKSRVLSLPALALMLASVAIAGPNEGGVLLVHTSNESYSDDEGPGTAGILCPENSGDCLEQEECSGELHGLNPSGISDAGLTPRVLWVLAGFPENSCPRVAGVSFGVEYDDTSITLTAWGSAGDLELPSSSWPSPLSGTAIAWASPKTSQLFEVYWFAGYAYYGAATLELLADPVQGGSFWDDSTPPQEEPIVGYGKFGFRGDQGFNPSPNRLACGMSAAVLDFGIIQIGASDTLSVEITNSGDGLLAGRVDSPCRDFLILGESSYSLEEGQSAEILIEFQPQALGAQICALDVGNGACPDLVLRGEAAVGPNANGTLIIHSTGVNWTTADTDTYCRLGLPTEGDCSSAVTNEAASELSSVWTISAAFPNGSSPRLSGVTFGLDNYDELTIIITDFAPCGDFELADANWPRPSTGTAITWNFAHLDQITPVYWIAGYEYYGLDVSLGLRTHPTQGGNFADDSVPAVLDPIAGYGSLGFNGNPGHLPCPVADGRICAIPTTPLDFGAVRVGDSDTLTLEIRNVGDELLAGHVTSPCKDFRVLDEASYTLEAGQSAEILIEFRPQGPGAQECTIDTGNEVCPDLEVRGEAVCFDVAPQTIDFGDVALGFPGVASVVVRNPSPDLILANVTVEASTSDFGVEPSFLVVSPNDSSVVSVTFEPTTPGPQVGEVLISSILDPTCSVEITMAGRGTVGETLCRVVPAQLDFGRVPVGSSESRSVQITNVGSQVLEGDIGACEGFDVKGGGVYSVLPGDSIVVSVSYSPTEIGNSVCLLDLGNGLCSTVQVSGEARSVNPTCEVTPSRLDFGGVPLGRVDTLQFVVKNAGGGVLSGEVTSPCNDFRVLDEAFYTLEEGQSAEILIEFRPQGPGAQECTIDTGNQVCPDLEVRGEAVCFDVAPQTIDFGDVALGFPGVASVVVRNPSPDLIIANVTVGTSSSDFGVEPSVLVVSPNDSSVVSVTFEPTTPGPQVGEVLISSILDPTCSAEITMAGRGTVGETLCRVAPTQLDFGRVPVGSSESRTIQITNVGDQVLEGDVGTCDGFDVKGGGAYSVLPGDSIVVSVTYSPTEIGNSVCLLDLGNELCSTVQVSGESRSANPTCEVAPGRLDFGGVPLGRIDTLQFVVKNAGGGVLSGEVTSPCLELAVLGDPVFSLTPGDSTVFSVSFEPLGLRDVACDVELGTECGFLAATGIGVNQGSPLNPNLSKPYPLPMRNSMSFVLTLPMATLVRAQVYDSQGRLVDTIVDGQVGAGSRKFMWIPTEPVNGMYYLRVRVRGNLSHPALTGQITRVLTEKFLVVE